jgi:hypothetical protein
MIPAIVMLLLAIERRIGQYGITENRYFLMVLSVWLAAIAVYFIASRQRFIKVIPVSLCILAFGTSLGPWGAYSVSRRSQTHRLEKLLQANNILVDGHIVAAPRPVADEDQREISAITRYLVERHSAKPFRRWLDPATFAVNDSTPRYDRENQRIQKIVKQMGLEYVSPYSVPVGPGRFEYMIEATEPRILDGAEYMVRLYNAGVPAKVGDTGLMVAWDTPAGVVVVRDGDHVVASVSAQTVLAGLKGSPAWKGQQVPAATMRAAVENDRIRLIVYFTMLAGTTENDTHTVTMAEAECFITPVHPGN